MRAFVHQSLPMRVVFGPGSLARLPDEIAALGLTRVLVLCSPEQRVTGEMVATALGARAAGVLAEAQMHVPIEVATQARDLAADLGADGCVAVGGGSAIGLGKAIALEHGLPVVAVPTTYAGSEMTPVWGLTENARKRTGRDARVLPRSVVYDPELTRSLPGGMTATSGINAMAHAVEALYAPDATPIISLMAAEGVRALVAALPRAVADGDDLPARAEAQYAAWLCGACLGATTMSLHHKLCHVLGGTLELPHAPTHTVVLPHVLAFNGPASPETISALSTAMGGVSDPARAIWELAGSLGAPRSLAELGMAESEIRGVVDQVVASPYANPRAVSHTDVHEVVRAAWAGEEPRSLG